MVDADQTFVIVGGGLAGAKAAETLRAEGYNGRVILIGDERDHPYERPPLSKGYLTGAKERDSVFVHEAAWYAANDVELHLGQSVTAIDREARTVRLGDGTVIRYDKLLLATGAEPRRLDVPGTELAGVHHLRRLAHADRLRQVLAGLGRDNGHLVIAGGGWIGLEVAAAARGYGAEVTVVEADPTPLHRVLGPELGQLFADLHSDHGVRFHFGARLTEIVGQDGMVLAVRTDDGEEHPAHAVLAAIGAAPVPSSPRTPGSRSSTGPTAAASPSTSPCAPPTPTSTPPGTSPPPTTRSCTPGSASSIGPTPSTAARPPPAPCSGSTSRTTGCPTSSPTSTTWAWSTPAGRPRGRTTRSSSGATPASASSSPSGSRRAGCSPA